MLGRALRAKLHASALRCFCSGQPLTAPDRDVCGWHICAVRLTASDSCCLAFDMLVSGSVSKGWSRAAWCRPRAFAKPEPAHGYSKPARVFGRAHVRCSLFLDKFFS